MNRPENLFQPPEYSPEMFTEYFENEKKRALRISEIEAILGDDYDLDHLRELVEADRKREFRRQLKRFDIMPTKKTHEKESRIELTDVKTCNLVEELKKREGVDVHVVENRSDMFVMAEGPAVVLVITD